MKDNKKLSITIDGVEKFPLDKNNVTLQYGDTVHIPDPSPKDIWRHEFVATVIDYLENGDIIVEDQDSDCFQMAANIVEKVSNN
jgi:hypothetical protein